MWRVGKPELQNNRYAPRAEPSDRLGRPWSADISDRIASRLTLNETSPPWGGGVLPAAGTIIGRW